MLAERQLETYNARRLSEFLECFDSTGVGVQVEILATQRIIYSSFEDFRTRYQTVFAQSNGKHPQARGQPLKCEVTKRLFLEPVHHPYLKVQFKKVSSL